MGACVRAECTLDGHTRLLRPARTERKTKRDLVADLFPIPLVFAKCRGIPKPRGSRFSLDDRRDHPRSRASAVRCGELRELANGIRLIYTSFAINRESMRFRASLIRAWTKITLRAVECCGRMYRIPQITCIIFSD